jgi:hypothetical protein
MVEAGTYLFDGVDRYFIKEVVKNLRSYALMMEVIK